MRKTGHKAYEYIFSVDCNTVDISDILEIHKCFMKRRSIVEMPGFIRQTFTALVLVLLSFKGSLPTKCLSMNNQSCMIRPKLSDLNPDDLYYYPCNGSSTIVENQFGIIRVTKQIQDVNFKVFNMIKGLKNQKS